MTSRKSCRKRERKVAWWNRFFPPGSAVSIPEGVNQFTGKPWRTMNWVSNPAYIGDRGIPMVDIGFGRTAYPLSTVDPLVVRIAALRKAVEIFTVYDSAFDFPGKFMVRRFWNDQPEPWTVCVRDSLDSARASIPMGLHRIPAHPGIDHPVIVETWL